MKIEITDINDYLLVEVDGFELSDSFSIKEVKQCINMLSDALCKANKIMNFDEN